nr:immunoglobulin light chain junction region [Macaca mulatta]MOW42147.1 immunoglobulin light chain junction region [Macaca mulatta]MOW42848.1 immunoglobulin light chain junction region [Macaca mulatta]MOW42924.1 immunoglobulin light chain junction region [Macaca mulatta]MOW44157.1 immunoglobulin light chain junction region [Macaca mulatta]
CQQGYDIITF